MIYQLQYTDYRTYLYTALFVTGNIVIPQLCHLIPQGGLVFLPIYFFTLMAAYKYGLTAGLMTALLSPIANHLLFEMPPMHVMPILLIKGSLLAVFAALIAKRAGKVTLGGIALAVIGYQVIGSAIEWPMTGSIASALQDLRIGYPGMIIQIICGYLLMKR